MNMIKKLLFTIAYSLILLSLIGCASSSRPDLKPEVEYDLNKDFGTLKTYAWLPGFQPQTGDADFPGLPRLHAHLREQLELQLNKQGYLRDNSFPDFWVAWMLTASDASQMTVMNDAYNYPMGWGAGRRFTLGVRNRPRKFVYQYQKGSLVIDFIHPQTRKLLWRASLQGEIDESRTTEERKQIISDAVTEILEEFPP